MSRSVASWLHIEGETETEIIIIVICKFEEIIKVESRSYLLKDENNIIEEKVPNGEVVVHHLIHYHYNHPCHHYLHYHHHHHRHCHQHLSIIVTITISYTTITIHYHLGQAGIERAELGCSPGYMIIIGIVGAL